MEWARAESGRTELSVQDVSLTSVAEEVIREMSSAARQKEIELGLEAPPDLPALATDRRIARLVLLDLVARAVQVTREGRVLIALAGGPGGESRILVHDMGDPVAPGDVEDLFDPLRTGDDLDRRSGSGSGLGLHAVRDIAAVIEGGLELVDGNTLVLTLRSLPRDRTTSKIRKMIAANDAAAHARGARSGKG
jgi:signal transduction histidine kinase